MEKWGARPDEIPTAIVAVAYPERERARLRLAGALMGPTRGNVLVVSIFRLLERLDDLSVQSYYDSIEERNQSLQAVTDVVREAGATVRSHVLVSATAFRGLVTAVETTRASLLLSGWPGHGPKAGEEALATSLDRHLRTHIVLFREDGPVPAQRILVLMDPSPHGELALLVGSRLAAAWAAELTVASVVPEDADEEARLQAEGTLEADVGISVRAAVRVIPATSRLEAMARVANQHDLIVLGPAGLGDATLASAVETLSGLTGCSLALVRAHPKAPMEARRKA